jgi:two-component system, chemotaxis family, chemotaxis protein CheY
MTSQACTGVVLIVDDEEDTRELIREVLEARGFQVATAEDGVEALWVVNKTPLICLVILDLLMPNMDGFEVLDRLAAGPERRELKIWISTSAPEKAPPGMRCLPKPVDVSRLLALVSEHCAGEACV